MVEFGKGGNFGDLPKVYEIGKPGCGEERTANGGFHTRFELGVLEGKTWGSSPLIGGKLGPPKPRVSNYSGIFLPRGHLYTTRGTEIWETLIFFPKGTELWRCRREIPFPGGNWRFPLGRLRASPKSLFLPWRPLWGAEFFYFSPGGKWRF